MAYSIDSRTIQPGDIFIPVKGEKFDGHDFIEQVKAKGATVLDVDLGKFAHEHRRKFNIPIIAVTGSAGKTTTKDMLAAVLAQKYNLVKSAENQNNEIGVPLTLLKIEPQHELAIIEMAMRGLGQIEYLAQLTEPTHAVITNIGFTHIELLKTREAIATAKSEVINKNVTVFLNRRDDYFDFLKDTADSKHATVIPYTYERTTEANQAAVVAIAKHFGLTDEQISKGLSGYQSSSHRLRTIGSQKYAGVTIIDDTYNSNPDGLTFALNIARETPAKRRIAVLGDMKELGEFNKILHEQVRTDGFDLVFGYGELASYFKHSKNFKTEQKEALIKELSTVLQPGDLLLIKGSRSMQMEEIVEALY